MLEPDHFLSPLDRANLLAGHAIAYATAFLDGRHKAHELARNAEVMQLNLDMTTTGDLAANAILDPVRMLNVAMTRAARAVLEQPKDGSGRAPWEARQDRWQQVMGALVELVRQESRSIAGEDR
jgi:hypothetical protein